MTLKRGTNGRFALNCFELIVMINDDDGSPERNDAIYVDEGFLCIKSYFPLCFVLNQMSKTKL